MNKLFTCIGVAFVGIAMVIGVGVAAGNNNVRSVYATMTNPGDSPDGSSINWEAVTSVSEMNTTDFYMLGYVVDEVQKFSTNATSSGAWTIGTFESGAKVFQLSSIENHSGYYYIKVAANSYINNTPDGKGAARINLVKGNTASTFWTVEKHQSGAIYLKNSTPEGQSDYVNNGRFIGRTNSTDTATFKAYTLEDMATHPFPTIYKYVEPTEDINLNSITIGNISEMHPGQTQQLSITFDPVNATDRELSYEITSGGSYATVSNTGLITAIAEGEVTVTVTPHDTHATAKAKTFTVTSYDAPTNIVVGKAYSFVSSGNYLGSSINYELTGFSGNVCSASSYDSNPTFSFPFKAVNGCYTNTIAFLNGSTYLSLNSNSNYLQSKNSIDQNSSWLVSRDAETFETVLTNVQFQNRTIRFNENGSTNKETGVKTVDPRFACYTSGQTAIRLIEQPSTPITDFTIDSEVTVVVGGTETIGVTYIPANATEDKTLNWVSSNNSIATVSNGVVTGVASGEATITASKTINEVLVERTCTVTVIGKAQHKGTQSDPYTVQEVYYIAKGLITVDYEDANVKTEDACVEGLLTATISRTTTTLSFWIGDNASQVSTATKGFEVFKVGKIGGEAMSYSDNSEVVADFPVGAKILAKGNIVNYNDTTPEFSAGSDILYNNYIDARKYAETFIKGSDNAGTCTATKAIWSTLATTYAALRDETKALFIAQEHEDSKNYDGSTAYTVAHAVARYDQVLIANGTSTYNDFMGRVSSGALVLAGQFGGLNGFNSSSSQSAIIFVVAISSISLLAIAICFVDKKRKHN